MDTNTLLLTSAFGLLVWGLILGFIIESASRSKKIERQLRIQTDLLSKIAERQGVTTEEVNVITDQK